MSFEFEIGDVPEPHLRATRRIFDHARLAMLPRPHVAAFYGSLVEAIDGELRLIELFGAGSVGPVAVEVPALAGWTYGELAATIEMLSADVPGPSAPAWASALDALAGA